MHCPYIPTPISSRNFWICCEICKTSPYICIEVNDKHRVCPSSVMVQGTEHFGLYRNSQLRRDVTPTSRIFFMFGAQQDLTDLMAVLILVICPGLIDQHLYSSVYHQAVPLLPMLESTRTCILSVKLRCCDQHEVMNRILFGLTKNDICASVSDKNSSVFFTTLFSGRQVHTVYMVHYQVHKLSHSKLASSNRVAVLIVFDVTWRHTLNPRYTQCQKIGNGNPLKMPIIG